MSTKKVITATAWTDISTRERKMNHPLAALKSTLNWIWIILEMLPDRLSIQTDAEIMPMTPATYIIYIYIYIYT